MLKTNIQKQVGNDLKAGEIQENLSLSFRRSELGVPAGQIW